MVEITIKLPEQVARNLGDKPEEMARRLLEDAAMEGYREGRLSHRQVGSMLGLDYWQTEAFLTKHGVPINYTLTDLEADQMALRQILGPT